MAKRRKRRKCAKCKGRLNLIGECLLCPMFEAAQPPGGPKPVGWPHVSYTMAVGTNPKELAAAREIDRQAGVKTEYDSRGRPIFTDPTHQRRYAKAHGAYDYDSGLGHS